MLMTLNYSGRLTMSILITRAVWPTEGRLCLMSSVFRAPTERMFFLQQVCRKYQILNLDFELHPKMADEFLYHGMRQLK